MNAVTRFQRQPKHEPMLTEVEWRLAMLGVVGRPVLVCLARLYREHGEPTPLCEHCQRYLELPAQVRAQVEAEAKGCAA